jgi:hypothetical protein
MGTGQSLSDALHRSTPATGPGKSAASSSVIPALVTVLWGYIAAARQQYHLVIKLQYIEIYNETLRDLLSGFSSKTASVVGGATGNSRPDIRETPTGEVLVEGAVVVTLSSPAELADAVDYGTSCRAVGSHKYGWEVCWMCFGQAVPC